MDVENQPAPRSKGQGAPPPLREDLTVERHRYLGRDFAVLKNPLGLTYFRLATHHYEAARLFDGRRPLREIARQLQEEDRDWAGLPEEEAVEDLAQLAGQLAFQGLLQTAAGATLSRFRQRREMKRSRRLEILSAKLLFFRRSLWDPDAVLARLEARLRWVFTAGFAFFFTLLVLSAVALVSFHTDRAAAHLGNFFVLPNLLLTWGIFILIKTLHEFGHGIASKHYGGEVHEMGILMIVFTPYFYCNVSDAWMLRKKHQRMLIGSAGILVELGVAAVAAWLWVLTQPGLFNQACFNVMLMCSVSTLVFNANPLLKFDGYYILADYLEIPNLKQKANQYVAGWAQKNLLGLKQRQQGFLAHEAGPWFGLYAVASYFYTWIIIFGISFYLFNVLEPFGLEALSRVYVVFFLSLVLVLPAYRLLKSVAEEPGSWPLLRRRAAAAVCLIALAGASSFLVPWEDAIRQTAVVKFAQVEQVTAPVDGFVREVLVKEGEVVKAGQPLARLENRELSYSVKDQELYLRSLEVELQRARLEGESNGFSAAYYQNLIAETEEELSLIRARLEESLVRAPRDGVLRGGELERLEGRFLRRGEGFCSIGIDGSYRLVISLGEEEARRVAQGQEVSARLYAFPGMPVSGVIDTPPAARTPSFSDENVAGGGGLDGMPISVAEDGRVRPAVPYFEAEVPLAAGEAGLREGMVGRVRVRVGETTLGLWWWDRVRRIGTADFRI